MVRIDQDIGAPEQETIVSIPKLRQTERHDAAEQNMVPQHMVCDHAMTRTLLEFLNARSQHEFLFCAEKGKMHIGNKRGNRPA